MMVPPAIKEFLKNLFLENDKIAWFVTNPDGFLITWEGVKEYHKLGRLKKGDNIQDLSPFLSGLFPLRGSKEFLPNIHMSKDHYIDIHIFKEFDNVFTLFVDNTSEVEKVRETLQEQNLSSLLKDKAVNHESLLLTGFNYACFSLLPDGQLISLNEFPYWLNNIDQDFGSSTSLEAMASRFPFVEGFLENAQEFWEAGFNGKIYSDAWTEGGNEGSEYHLQAIAVTADEKQYLCLLTPESYSNEKQEIIQKARERTLDYEKLEKTERMLRKLIRFKDQFVSIVSHDLRSPIASVISMAEYLSTDQEFIDTAGDNYAGMISRMRDELFRLLEYNDKLYNWSSLEFGNFELKYEDKSVRQYINELLQRYLPRTEKKNQHILINIKDEFDVHADPIFFGQVLNNLVENAIKFSYPEGNIYLTSYIEDGLKIISIKDEGIGIPVEHQEKLFTEFQEQHRQGTSGEKGTGLGLSICHKIIDAHDFELILKSALGEGTEFLVKIS